VEKPEGNRPLQRSTCRWGDNIKMESNEIRWQDVGWINLAYDREVAGCCENGNEPSGAIKCGEFDWLKNYQLLKTVSATLSDYCDSHLNTTLNAKTLCM
jgi:hypothetical protein